MFGHLHATRMENKFKEIDSIAGWPQLFQQIRNECSNYEFSSNDARKTENKSLNRYRDVSPYDHSRVKLQSGYYDYINASLVKVPNANRAYILTQGPLPNTTSHFWQMVWEQNTKAVLMLNKVIEKDAVKCHQYWPLGSENGNSGSDELVFESVGLKVRLISENAESYYTVRHLQLIDLMDGSARIVLHFHYTTWPDFGVPQSHQFLNFLMAVRQSGVLEENVGPTVVHCSAGIGRSGTFCLVDSCLVLIEKCGALDEVDVKQVLLDMRKYRMGLIQTPDQLRFSYLAVIEGAKRILAKSNDNKIPFAKDKRKAQSSDSEDENDNEDHAPSLPPRRQKTADIITGNSTEDERGCNNIAVAAEAEDKLRDTDLRRRQRKEKQEKTELKVAEMTRRQRDSEKWRHRRSLLKPLSFGLVLLLGGSFLVYRYIWKA